MCCETGACFGTALQGRSALTAKPWWRSGAASWCSPLSPSHRGAAGPAEQGKQELSGGKKEKKKKKKGKPYPRGSAAPLRGAAGGRWLQPGWWLGCSLLPCQGLGPCLCCAPPSTGGGCADTRRVLFNEPPCMGFPVPLPASLPCCFSSRRLLLPRNPFLPLAATAAPRCRVPSFLPAPRGCEEALECLGDVKTGH